jgi:hypothetical protein
LSDIDPLDPEHFRLNVGTTFSTTARSPRMGRSSAKFARVRLPWLTDRQWDDVFDAKARLFLYLLILSREGRKEVVLSNKGAAAVGISRYQKWAYLRQLEEHGLVRVVRSGRSTPVVMVNAMPGDPSTT